MTRSDRLAAVLVKAGVASEQEITTGQWADGACPYTIRTTPDGGRRIEIDKGDVVIRASGPTLEAALAALEAKVG